MSRGEWLALLLAALLVAAALAAIGGYAPWLSPDTPGYLAVPPLPEGWANPRHPLFGSILGLLPGREHAMVPALQTGLFLAATAFLHHSLRAYGLSRRAAWSVTAALLGSNLLLLWHTAVHPELPAVVAMLAAIGCIVRVAAGGAFVPFVTGFGLLLGLAYILRPSFLPAILLLPLLYAGLARLRGEEAIGRRAAALALVAALPFLINSGLRWRAVGDFNIVSFGGYQMSGMAGLMLTPEIVARLPDDLRALGQAILEARTEAERAGEVIATPLNSRGERSFVSTALGYYDLYARTYDDLLQRRIGPLQRGENWVSFNARLMRLSLATIQAAPDRYLAWVAGGTMRFVGRLFAANLAFALATAAWLAFYAAALWRRRLPVAEAAGDYDVPALLCLTFITVVSAGALTVVTTFPAARYIDTAGLFLPALPIYGALTLLAALRWPRRG
jgi:hypothetical protein